MAALPPNNNNDRQYFRLYGISDTKYLNALTHALTHTLTSGTLVDFTTCFIPQYLFPWYPALDIDQVHHTQVKTR